MCHRTYQCCLTLRNKNFREVEQTASFLCLKPVLVRLFLTSVSITPHFRRPSVMVENTVVTIDWSDPVVDSWFSGRKFWYRVQCERCPTNVQTPTEVYESAVRLSGLAEFTRYAVRIFTENTLTMHNPNSAQSVLVEFETKNKGLLPSILV